ncbi:MAG: MFS transporter [Rhodothermales bacterium]|nr:MFS transporter [Rhodothermales bacterium]
MSETTNQNDSPSAGGSENLRQLVVEPATRERVTLRLAFILCCLFLGTAITEASSVYVLPLTIERFTPNPLYIALILALNPLFGIIAQPLAGLISDRIWTPLGRRAFLMIVSAPIVALALLFVPYASVLWHIVLLVVVIQFFQDILYGSDQPLLADLVPPEQRTLMLGLVKGFENLGFLLVLYLGMKLVASYRLEYGAERYGLPMYFIAAGAQIALVMIPAFFLRERRIVRDKIERMTPARYVRDFIEQPMLLRLAAAYSVRSFTRTAVVGFVALYAVKTLGFTEDQVGSSWGIMPFVALILGIPLGLMVERFAKHRALQAGFLIIIVGSLLGYSATSPMALAGVALIFGCGDMILEVTHKAFMSDRYPADKIGQLTGAVNIFYAIGRTAALILVGAVVKAFNPDVDWKSLDSVAQIDYSVIWIVAIVAAVAGILLLHSARDYRHEARVARSDVDE